MKNKKRISMLILIVMLVSLTGCAEIRDKIGLAKGQLIGQNFHISAYNHYGSKVMEISGKKVTVEELQKSSNIDDSTEGHKSGVLEITINGKQMFQVGNTLLFEENGLDMVEGFEVPKEIELEKGGGFVPIDRFINDYANRIGKSKTVIISSPMGIPIGVYQGKNVYVTVPKDLPKMTRLNIDGKSLYIHRANYIILDSDIIKENK